MTNLENSLVLFAKTEYQKEIKDLSANELHNVVSSAVMAEISDRWAESQKKHNENKRAYYLSAEFLVGRAIYNNLFCLNLGDEVYDRCFYFSNMPKDLYDYMQKEWIIVKK